MTTCAVCLLAGTLLFPVRSAGGAWLHLRQWIWLSAGAPFLPYLITDRVVAPESCRKCYSEHLVLMPNCYFVNDYKRAHMVPRPPPPLARPSMPYLPMKHRLAPT